MERALVERARSGDRAAFDALVRSRIDAVYRTSLAILGAEADAADATQEPSSRPGVTARPCATRTFSTPGWGAST